MNWKIDWFKIIGAVSMVILVSAILYGAYQFYFCKPIPIINQVMPNATATFNQQKPEKTSGRWITGVIAGKGFLGGHLSYMW